MGLFIKKVLDLCGGIILYFILHISDRFNCGTYDNQTRVKANENNSLFYGSPLVQTEINVFCRNFDI